MMIGRARRLRVAAPDRSSSTISNIGPPCGSLEEALEKGRGFIRDAGNLVGCLAIEFEIQLGPRPAVIPIHPARLSCRFCRINLSVPRIVVADAALMHQSTASSLQSPTTDRHPRGQCLAHVWPVGRACLSQSAKSRLTPAAGQLTPYNRRSPVY